MANAKNKVIAGDYYNYKVSASVGVVTISLLLVETITVDKTTVKNYEVITDEHRKSAKSGVARGLAGKMLLGNVGAMAGVYSARDKGIYQIAIEFKNDKRSLLEVDDKIYKLIIKNCFACSTDKPSESEPPKREEDVSEAESTKTDKIEEEAPKPKQKANGCMVTALVILMLFVVLLTALAISSISKLNTLNVSHSIIMTEYNKGITY